MKSKEEVIALIRKLFNLGNRDRNSSESEAEAALQKAQELLQKHDLDMSEIVVDESQEKVINIEVENEIVFELKRSSMSSWEKTLIIVIGTATETNGYFNKVYNGGGSIIWQVGYIGTEWDRSIAKELYLYLHEKIYRMSKQFYGNDMPAQRCFMEGFVMRLYTRVKTQMDSFKKEVVGNQKYEMVLFEKKNAIEKYGKEILHLRISKGRKGGGEWNPFAYAHGQREADKVDLNVSKDLTHKGA